MPVLRTSVAGGHFWPSTVADMMRWCLAEGPLGRGRRRGAAWSCCRLLWEWLFRFLGGDSGLQRLDAVEIPYRG